MLQARDARARESAAHGLKGSAATVGAAVLAARCGAIEDAAYQNDLDGATSLLHDLAGLADLTRAALTGL